MDVWADQTALYIWSGGEKADLTPVKAAKRQLERERDHLGGIQDIPAQLVPIGASSLSDLPSLDARVLAIGSRPPFICNYALTSPKTSAEGWVRALCWVLGIAKYDSKATLIEDILISQFGPGVREITPEELEAERKMLAYLAAEE